MSRAKQVKFENVFGTENVELAEPDLDDQAEGGGKSYHNLATGWKSKTANAAREKKRAYFNPAKPSQASRLISASKIWEGKPVTVTKADGTKVVRKPEAGHEKTVYVAEIPYSAFVDYYGEELFRALYSDAKNYVEGGKYANDSVSVRVRTLPDVLFYIMIVNQMIVSPLYGNYVKSLGLRESFPDENVAKKDRKKAVRALKKKVLDHFEPYVFSYADSLYSNSADPKFKAFYIQIASDEFALARGTTNEDDLAVNERIQDFIRASTFLTNPVVYDKDSVSDVVYKDRKTTGVGSKLVGMITEIINPDGSYQSEYDGFQIVVNDPSNYRKQAPRRVTARTKRAAVRPDTWVGFPSFEITVDGVEYKVPAKLLRITPEAGVVKSKTRTKPTVPTKEAVETVIADLHLKGEAASSLKSAVMSAIATKNSEIRSKQASKTSKNKRSLTVNEDEEEEEGGFEASEGDDNDEEELSGGSEPDEDQDDGSDSE